jgi:antitoxin component YwqK of YwqJK toxin-antitoxin module
MLQKLLIILILAPLCCAAQMFTSYYPNGNKCMEGILIDADPAVFTADFAQKPKMEQARYIATAKRDGKWQQWYENGNISSIEFYNAGIMVGNWKQYLMDGTLTADIHFGSKTTFYHNNGQKESEGILLTNYVYEGAWRGWFANGNLNFEGSYQGGMKEGNWIWYREDGTKDMVQVYRQGELVEEKR